MFSHCYRVEFTLGGCLTEDFLPPSKATGWFSGAEMTYPLVKKSTNISLKTLLSPTAREHNLPKPGKVKSDASFARGGSTHTHKDTPTAFGSARDHRQRMWSTLRQLLHRSKGQREGEKRRTDDQLSPFCVSFFSAVPHRDRRWRLLSDAYSGSRIAICRTIAGLGFRSFVLKAWGKFNFDGCLPDAKNTVSCVSCCASHRSDTPLTRTDHRTPGVDGSLFCADRPKWDIACYWVYTHTYTWLLWTKFLFGMCIYFYIIYNLQQFFRELFL